MTQHIWIVNEYAGSPLHGQNYRHYYLGREFTRRGYAVTLISASQSHLFYQKPNVRKAFHCEDIDGLRYVWVKVPSYSHASSPKRVLKWLVYSSKLFALPKLPRPDVILCSPTATFPIIPAYYISRKKNAKFILEIRDIWPLSMTELGDISNRHPLVLAMQTIERFGIRKCDRLVSNLQHYDHYLRALNIDKPFTYIPNGITPSPQNTTPPLPSEIRNLLPQKGFIVGYAGTIGRANALLYLIEAAKKISTSDIKIVLVGQGQEKKRLQKLANGLNNVYFLPFIPKNKVQAILSFFDTCYIGWHKKYIYKYGIAANKLFDYMLAGKPILNSCNCTENIIEEAQCGITVAAEDGTAIADGLRYCYNLPKETLQRMGENGKKYVLQHHRYDKISRKYIELF